MGLDGVATAEALTGFRFREWGWSARTATGTMTATLTIPAPGFYTVNVWAREDGARLDRLLLALDAQYVPTGSGPAESARLEAGDALAAGPPSTASSHLVANPEAATRQAREQARAQLWAMLLSNPGILLLGPLALVAPQAYARRRRRKVQFLTGLLLILALVLLGVALAHGAAFAPDTAALPLPASALQAGGETTISYTYDPLQRLTGAVYGSGESFAYTYDAAGNRLTQTINGGAASSYSYDAANRLTMVDGQAYSYDDNGNLLSDGLVNYSYDSANRLTLADDGVSTLSYLYNGDGARLAQIVDGLRTDYVQDVAGPLPQVLAATEGGTTTRYLRGLGLIGEQRGSEPAGWQYHLSDALGSVRQTADAAGAVTLRRSYDPFGALSAVEGPGSTVYGFAGEEQDTTTGHVYLRARTYNPAVGRFLQQDSELGLPMQPNTLHRYAYAFNNPVNVVDPSGHMPALGRSVNPANAGGAGAISFNTPARSANNGGWSSFSDPVARQQSAGFRPDVCGMLADLGVTLLNVGESISGIDRSMENFLDDVGAFVHDPRDPGHLIDAYDDLRNAGRNASTALEEVQRFRHRNRDTLRYLATVGIDIMAQAVLAVSPLDWVIDIGSYLTGRDLLTGHKLSKLEKGLLGAALVAGVFSFGLGDDVLQAGGRLSRYGDELAGAGRYTDEAAGIARYSDESGDMRRGARLANNPGPPRKRVLVVGDNSEVTFRIPGRGERTVPSFNYSRLLARENSDVIVVGTRLGNPADPPEVFHSHVIPNLTVAKNIDATQLSKYTDEIGDSFDFVVFTAPRADAPLGATEIHGKLVDDFLASSESMLRPEGSVLISSTPGMPAGPRLEQMVKYPESRPANYVLHPPEQGFVDFRLDNIQFGVRGYIPVRNEGGPIWRSDRQLEFGLKRMNWYRFLLGG